MDEEQLLDKIAELKKKIQEYEDEISDLNTKIGELKDFLREQIRDIEYML